MGVKDTGWKIDKHIPVAVLIGMGLQLIGFVWMFAKMDSRIEALESWRITRSAEIVKNDSQIHDRLRVLETETATIKVQVNAIKESSNRIENKIDQVFTVKGMNK